MCVLAGGGGSPCFGVGQESCPSCLRTCASLVGSVRKAGERVRITAQLVNAANEAQVWGERYDRELKDIFALQDEIAQRLAEQLKSTLGGDSPLQARASVDPHRALRHSRSQIALYFDVLSSGTVVAATEET